MINLIIRLWNQWNNHALGIANVGLGLEFDHGKQADPPVVACRECCQTFVIGNDAHICTVRDITDE